MLNILVTCCGISTADRLVSHGLAVLLVISYSGQDSDFENIFCLLYAHIYRNRTNRLNLEQPTHERWFQGTDIVIM